MESIKRHLTGLITRPPRTVPDAVNVMRHLYPHRNVLNKHVYDLSRTKDDNPEADAEAGVIHDMLCKACGALINAMADNVGELGTMQGMRFEGPWSANMCLFTLLAALVVISEPLKGGVGWGWDYPSTECKYLRHKHLCVSDILPVDHYKVSDVVDAIFLLSLRWHRLKMTDELRRYMYALIHRGAILVGRPASEHVHNEAVLSVEQKVGQQEVRCANGNLIRRLADGLMCLLFIARTPLRLRMAKPGPVLAEFAPGIETLIDNIRRYQNRQAGIVVKATDTKMEVSSEFSRFIVSFADIDLYIEKRNNEPPKTQAVMMVTKTAEGIQAWTRLRELVILDKVVEYMQEEEPGYFDTWSYAQHVYCVLMKLYVLEMPFRERGLNFRNDFVVWEASVVKNYHDLINETHPMIAMMMGRMHVFYEKRVYPCPSIEHAFAVWGLLVLNRIGGMINGVDLRSPIKEILEDDVDANPMNEGDSRIRVSEGVIVE